MIKNLKYIIQGYSRWIWGSIYPPYRKKQNEIFSKRLQICESCEYLMKSSMQCDLCGCFVKAKVRTDYDLDKNSISIDGCPEKKW